MYVLEDFWFPNLFLDDTALRYAARNSVLINHNMKNDFNNRISWFTVHRMALIIKNKFLQFSIRLRTYVFGNVYFKCRSCLLQLNVTSQNCIKIDQVEQIMYL